jgi:hypothetical protein
MNTGTPKTVAILWPANGSGNPLTVRRDATWSENGVTVHHIPHHQVRLALQLGLPVYGWMTAEETFPVYGLRAEHLAVHQAAYDLEIAEDALRSTTGDFDQAIAQVDRCRAAVDASRAKCDRAVEALAAARAEAGLPPLEMTGQ